MRNLHKSVFGLITEKRDKVILCGVFGFVFMLVFMILGGKAQADLQPIKTIELTSQNTSYANNQPGAWKIDKSAEWIGEGKARITFEVNTIPIAEERPKDVLLILDNSGSMAGNKLEKVRSDSKELVSYLLSSSNNRVALVTFDTTATVRSDFTNSESTIMNTLDSMLASGATNYYDALLKAETILEHYSYSTSRDLVVLFLSDGYPCEDTPNEVSEYKYLKDMYPYVFTSGVQYEMGEVILDPLKTVSDEQYVADMDSLNNSLFDAVSTNVRRYDKLIITDYIEDNYFDTIVSVKSSIGSVSNDMDGTTPRVTWDLSNKYRWGSKAYLYIDVSLGSNISDDFGGLLPTNKYEKVESSALDIPDENIVSTLSPSLLLNYSVSYDGNAPRGCSVVGDVPSSRKYKVFTSIEISPNTLSCEGYYFKEWKVVDTVSFINDDYFIMPEKNVTIKAIWEKIDIEKTTDGVVNQTDNAELDTGSVVNRKLMRLAGSSYSYDSRIVGIKMANELPLDFIESADNTISSSDSNGKIYAWFDSGDGYINIYTAKSGIRLNQDSRSLFNSMSHLTDISGIADWDTSHVVDMSYLFEGCSSLSDLSPLKEWDTSNVENLQYAFTGYYHDIEISDLRPLQNWDVSKVKNMHMLFDGAYRVTDLSPLANWDVSSVTDMSGIFDDMRSVTSFRGLENWDTSSVTTLSGAFRDMKSLTDISTLSNWDTSSVSTLSSLFYGAESLSDVSALDGWDMSSVTYLSNMFDGASSIESVSSIHWDVPNLLYMNGMFRGASSLRDISSLATLDTSKVKSFSSVFSGARSLVDISPLSSWSTASLTNMEQLFYDASSITSLDSLAGWDVSKVTTIQRMCAGASSLTDISVMAGWDVSSVETMWLLFAGASSLEDISALRDWSFPKVTHLGDVFSGTSISDLSPIAGWDVSNVKVFDSLFAKNTSLVSVAPLSGWDTSSATDFGGLFNGDENLVDISALSSWVTDSVVQMDYIFANTAISDLSPISGWNTGIVDYAPGMFSDMPNLVDLTPIANWDVSAIRSFARMFENDAAITNLRVLDGWDVSASINFQYMFDGIPASVQRPSWFNN